MFNIKEDGIGVIYHDYENNYQEKIIYTLCKKESEEIEYYFYNNKNNINMNDPTDRINLINKYIFGKDFYNNHVDKLKKIFDKNIYVYNISRYYYINGSKVSYDIDIFSSFLNTDLKRLDVIVIDNAFSVSNLSHLQVMSHTKNILYVQGEITFTDLESNTNIILKNKEYYIGILCQKSLLMVNF